METVSLENIQACILVGEYVAAVSDRAAEIHVRLLGHAHVPDSPPVGG
jgi:hypothetical protein